IRISVTIEVRYNRLRGTQQCRNDIWAVETVRDLEHVEPGKSKIRLRGDVEKVSTGLRHVQSESLYGRGEIIIVGIPRVRRGHQQSVRSGGSVHSQFCMTRLNSLRRLRSASIDSREGVGAWSKNRGHHCGACLMPPSRMRSYNLNGSH